MLDFLADITRQPTDHNCPCCGAGLESWSRTIRDRRSDAVAKVNSRVCPSCLLDSVLGT